MHWISVIWIYWKKEDIDLLMLTVHRVLVSKHDRQMMTRIDIELLIKIAFYVSYLPNVSSHPVTKSSLLVLRNFLYILTLNFSVFPKPPSNVSNWPKMPQNRWKWNTYVASFLILNLNFNIIVSSLPHI